MTPTIEDILSHDLWLRRTALALTRDASTADDLVQDAWVVGLEKERTGQEDRPWFRGLLKHRLAGKRRAAANAGAKARMSLEEGPRFSLAADEVVEASELRQSVARELLGLEEPLRQAVYLRFIAGQSNSQVARETGVAESTASQRIGRGLDELRRRLDASVAGGRAAWAPALVRMAAPTKATAVPAGGLAIAGLAAGAILCVGGVAAAVLSGDPQAIEPIEVSEANIDFRKNTARAPGGKPRDSRPDGHRSALPVRQGPSRSRRSRGQGPPPPVAVPSSSATRPPSKSHAATLPHEQGEARTPSEGAITVHVVEPILFHAFGVRLDETRVHLVSTSGSPRVESPTRSDLEPSADEAFDVLFDKPSPGAHRVEISDPRFDPYTSKPIERGSRVDVRLVGSASIHLNVEAPGGSYPTDLEVTLTYKEICSTASSHVATLNGGLIDDVVPWSYTLTARALEGTATVDVDDLAPLESRVVNVQLAPRGQVSGWIQYPGGHPAAGAFVRLVSFRGEHRPGDQLAEVNETWSLPPNRQAVAETLAGAQGEFTLQAESEGRYVVIVGRAGAPQIESAPIDLARSEIMDALELTIPRGGRVAGQITALGGQKLAGSKVLTFDQERKSTRPTFPKPLPVAPDGRFDLGPLPAGKIWIYWYEAGHTNFGADISGGPMGGEFLGVVDVVENETVHAVLSLAR